jgi:hypothetical protein
MRRIDAQDAWSTGRVQFAWALVPILFALCAPPAHAASVGATLPKARMLRLATSDGSGGTSWGCSVQVVGGAFTLGLTTITLGLDYAYTRDFAAGANYAFFDGVLGVGVPFALTPSLYLTPAADVHALAFVASPLGVDAPGFGYAPRLTLGWRPASNVSVELAGSYVVLPGLSRGGAAAAVGGMTVVELGGVFRL